MNTLIAHPSQARHANDALDPAYPAIPGGQPSLKMVWGSLIAAAGALASLTLLTGWLLLRL